MGIVTRYTKYLSVLVAALWLTSSIVYAVGDDELFVEEPPTPTDLNKQIANLTTGLQTIINEKIPKALMQQAKAIAVVDGTKFGFVVAIGSGKGLLTIRCSCVTPVDPADYIRCPGTQWTDPALVTRSSASIGWQAGLEAKTAVLVFTDCEDVPKLLTGNLKLGAGLDLSVGPLATEVGTDMVTDMVFDKKVYTYSDGVGLFGGVSLKGSSLSLDALANEGLYGEKELTADKIFAGQVTPKGGTAAAVANLKNLLRKASK